MGTKMTLSDDEIIALLLIKKLLRSTNPPLPEFILWVKDRLVLKHGDDEFVDFVQTLKRISEDLEKIRTLVDR